MGELRQVSTFIYTDTSHNNIGDRLENPALYFNLPNPKFIDIYCHDIPEHTPNDIFIFGGGGLVHPALMTSVGEIMSKVKAKTILIGGHNFHDTTKIDKWPECFKFFDLIGLRDYTESSQKLGIYCPPQICMHPLIDDYIGAIPDKDYVIFNHKDDILGHGMSNAATNAPINEQLNNILEYLSHGRVVITNSYHGFILATYLNKPVIVIPHSTKFYMTRYPAKMVNNLNDAIKCVNTYKFTTYPSALEQDRLYATKFMAKVHNLINDNLTIAYEIGSHNIGDNLVWFTEIINHIREKQPKKAYIRTTLNKMLSEINHDISETQIEWLKPTEESYDRIHRLGVNMVSNWRELSMNGIAKSILALDNNIPEYKMDLSKLAHPRPIQEKYITYASHGSWRWKAWQYPNGWQILSEMVDTLGYKMIDCSLESNQIPKDLQAGALTYIHHSEAFIGGPSGLSWLAYYLNKKQVLMSGISFTGTEMPENDKNIKIIRTKDINDKLCNGCYHWCNPFPATHQCAMNKNFECWECIKPDIVFDALKSLLDTKA